MAALLMDQSRDESEDNIIHQGLSRLVGPASPTPQMMVYLQRQ